MQEKDLDQAAGLHSHAVPEEDEGESVALVKADVISFDEATQSKSTTEDEGEFAEIDNVVPYPLPEPFKTPESFVEAWLGSASLQPPIETYATDVHGLGHTFVPTVNLEADDAPDKLREAHEMRRTWMVEYRGEDPDKLPEAPTDEELGAEVEELWKQAKRERLMLDVFFGQSVRESTFERLRVTTCGQESETGGNWYWEVVRHKETGKPLRLKGVPFQTVRALKEDKTPTEVDTPIQISPIHWDVVHEKRYFRRYAQRTGWGAYIYFKEFGDPRLVCSHCGKYFKNPADMKRNGTSDCTPATEILHDGAMHVPGSIYRLPRWIGAVTHVFGEQGAAQHNQSWFVHNTIPTGAFLVSGGQLAAGTDKKLRDFLIQNVRGRTHRLIVLQAFAKGGNPMQAAHNVKIEWVPMMADRQSDGQFLEYSRHCEEKVAKQFRLPGLLYGDSKQLNRATAWAALKFAEERVFQPLRNEFDALMNRTLLPALGIRLWKFRTNAPETRDPAALSKILHGLVQDAAITIEESRAVAADILSREFAPLDTDWSDTPLEVLRLGLGGETDDEEQPAPKGDEYEDVDTDDIDEDETGDGPGEAQDDPGADGAGGPDADTG